MDTGQTEAPTTSDMKGPVMGLVTVVEIELFRPRSAISGAFGMPSNPQTALVVVENDDAETLKEHVLKFAERCGIERSLLQGLHRVPDRQFSRDHGVVVFDMPMRNVQFSTPYAACKSEPALKIGDQYFKLAEILGVSSA